MPNIFDSIKPNFKLTSDQSEALIQISSFLDSSYNCFLLKGFAGTGKTTLMQIISSYLNSIGRASKLFAPTGRAALILQQKTKKKACTIHRGIYNFKDLLEKKEGESFKFYYGLHQNEDSADCVYLIDEASMISDKYSEDEFFMFGSGYLLKDLSEYVFSRNVNRKIIFIGDNAQLPPVNMSFSPALNISHLKERYNLSILEFELKQVVRQLQDSGILKTVTKLRESISQNVFNEFEIDFSKDDTHKCNPENLIETYTKVAKNGGVQNNIIITHSNRQALEHNQKIRMLRYGENYTQVQKRDRLLITKNNYNGEIELFNGMFAEVIEVGNINRKETVRFKKKGGKTEERELIFRDVLVKVRNEEGKLCNLKTTLLDKFLTSEEGRLHPLDQQALYVDFKNRMTEKGIRPKTTDYNHAIRNDLYFNALQAKYGYAITCHKSQGGEWKNAFVDFKVYMGIMNMGFFRWAYTAMTRAKENLYVIDAPHYNALSKYVIKDILPIKNVLKGAYYVPSSKDEPFYFVEYRKQRIQKSCNEVGIDVKFTSHNNQLDTVFAKGEDFSRVKLWYKDFGFSKNQWVSQSSEGFKAKIERILIHSLLPDEIPFIPKFDFQKDLHNYLLEILKEENIPITNIIQNEWNDQYFIYTNTVCTVLEFSFDKKHIYKSMQPKSTLGEDDKILVKIIDRLKGNL